MTNLSDELDMLIESSRETNLTAVQLIDLQSSISGIKYTLGTMLAVAEGKYMAEKDRVDLHVLRGRLALQAVNTKLPNTKATDMVENQTDTELMRQKLIQLKVEYSGLKHRVDGAKDVLISIAMRLGRLEDEEIQSRSKYNA